MCGSALLWSVKLITIKRMRCSHCRAVNFDRFHCVYHSRILTCGPPEQSVQNQMSNVVSCCPSHGWCASGDESPHKVLNHIVISAAFSTLLWSLPTFQTMRSVHASHDVADSTSDVPDGKLITA